MKNIIILLVFLPLINLSQTEKINGLGTFKINESTTKAIEAYAKENKLKITEINNYNDYLMKCYSVSKANVFKIYPDTLAKKHYQIPKTKLTSGVSVYLIKSYEIIDIKIKTVYLSYYNDTLIEIALDGFNEDIITAFRTKYGEGKKTSDSKTIECTYNLTGNAVTKSELRETETWENGSIITYYYNSFYYNQKCEPQLIQTFDIKNKAKFDFVERQNKIKWQEIEDKQKDSTKEKLKGL